MSSNRSHRAHRTLHRRAGGHLSLAESTTESSTKNTSDSSSERFSSVRKDVKNHKSFFRLKTSAVPTKHDNSDKAENVKEVRKENRENPKDLWEKSNDENNLDYGLMTLSAAGEGNEDASKLKNKKLEEKTKTLSDQIAEGKYGLIEKELFANKPIAPGIISYKTNSETPEDNAKTLGGLDKDEIWLAEDHLLVLKGGLTNKKNNENSWKPIDDYEAPKRPVKIPVNPRVPPPFPVQFENEPLQFIGYNQFSVFNPFTNQTRVFGKNSDKGAPNVNQTSYHDSQDFAARFPGANKTFTRNQIPDVVPPPPWIFPNSNNNADLLKQFPFNLPLPDQALNRTEDFDEDDPSLFYPPPYSFIYKSNYTNLAPVGPFVPGIILPPPPNFFSVYDPEENKKPVKTPIDVINRINEIHLHNRLSVPASSTQPPISKTTFLESTTRASTANPTKKLNRNKPPTTRVPVSPYVTKSEYSTTPKHYETSTLKLFPVYVPTKTTKIYQTTTVASTTTPRYKSYKEDYGTQTHPIYFEYFDARTAIPFEEVHIGSNVPGEYSVTTAPPVTVPVPVYSETKKKKPKSYHQFLPTSGSPPPDGRYQSRPEYAFENDNFGAVISPYPYSVNTASPNQYNIASTDKPLILEPVGRFEDEIAAIRQTLNFYNGNIPSKVPKVKAVYEFSFESSNHRNRDGFKPMLSYDQQHYYSAKPTINNSQPGQLTRVTSGPYQTTTQSPTKHKNKVTSASTSLFTNFGDKMKPQDYYIRPAIVKEIRPLPQLQSQRLYSYPSYEIRNLPKNTDKNNRNVKHRNTQLKSQQQQQFYGKASEVASLLNDTAVNYKHPQRPINPYSEFIEVPRFPVLQSPYIPVQQYPIHHPIYPYPRPTQQQYQHQAQQYQQLTDFRYPQVPQINPDSVQITFYNRPMEKSDRNVHVDRLN